MYDDVLELKFSKGVNILSVSDTEAINAVENRMRGKKFAIAHHKTDMVIISNRKVIQQAEIIPYTGWGTHDHF